MLDFRSDNTAAASPAIMQAMLEANSGSAPSYGADRWTRELQESASALFGKPVRIYPVATGTAANAVSMASLAGPFGCVYCHPDAHLHLSEYNAAGFFGAGAKIMPVPTPGGKLTAEAVESALADAAGWPHRTRPAVVSLTQATEAGRVYSCEEVEAIAAVAHARGLRVHMDGARFANAVAHLGCSSGEMTWQSGVDVLSLGVTKNGGLNADAIVIFTEGVAPDIEAHLQRAGQVWSKMRFASAQLGAWLADGLWLRLARAANEGALRIAAGAESVTGVRVLAPVEANEVFLEANGEVLDELARHVLFARRGRRIARLVTRWDNTGEEIESLVAALRAAAAA